MSFYSHPGAYNHELARVEELRAYAAHVRELEAAGMVKLGIVTQARKVLGAWLIALGERVTPASLPAPTPVAQS